MEPEEVAAALTHTYILAIAHRTVDPADVTCARVLEVYREYMQKLVRRSSDNFPGPMPRCVLKWADAGFVLECDTPEDRDRAAKALLEGEVLVRVASWAKPDIT